MSAVFCPAPAGGGFNGPSDWDLSSDGAWWVGGTKDSKTLRAGVWHDWRRLTPLATGIWLCALSVFATAFPAALHGMVGVYGLCLFAMAFALYTDPAPAAVGDVRDVQLQRV